MPFEDCDEDCHNTRDDTPDPLLVRIRSRITEWKTSKPNTSIGSVRAVDAFINSLSDVIEQTSSGHLSPTDAANQLIQTKLKLNTLVQQRLMTRSLVESMIAAEYLMHETIDYLLSHPDCDNEPCVDFRFNWAPLIYPGHKDEDPMYLTQYGVEFMLRRLVTNQ
jgi:hypothetical protein